MDSNSTLPSPTSGAPETASPKKRGGGPNTPEGKARSSMNALKHGCYSVKLPLLRTESPEAFQAHCNLYYARYNPVDEVEKTLVHRIAFADWRLSLLATLEAHAVDSQLEDIENAPYSPDGAAQVESTIAALNKALAQPCLHYINRREAALSRLRTRTVKELEDLRRLHPVLAPEPEFLPEAPDSEEIPAPEPKSEPEPSPILLPPFPAAQEMTKRTPSQFVFSLYSPSNRRILPKEPE